MSQIKATQQLKAEDFPTEHREWLRQLITPINDFFRQGISILNGGATFKDQSVGTDYTWTFTYQTDAITFPILMAWNYKLPARALHVNQALEDGEPFAALVSWQFVQVISNQALQSQLPQVQLLGLWKVASPGGTPGVQALTQGLRYDITTRISP